MINRFFFLFSALVFLIGSTSSGIASGSFPTHTQYTPELEPASILELGNSYQIASVCFLGSGCDEGSFIKNNENMDIDPSKQCQNEGYLLTSCPQGKYPQKYCPYNNRYFASCGAPSNQQKCENEGYFINCDEGKSLQASQSCPYDSNYKKCVCTDCSAYTYTLSQASASGYETDGSCNSCGTVKYKRKKAECNGFKTCECGGEIGASTCKSGTDTKYSNCKECPKCDNSCNGQLNSSSGLYCSNDEVVDWNLNGCGNYCYACCKPSCHTEKGEMIRACGEGSYVSDYNFDGPIYKKVSTLYHYGENSGDGNCGNVCWTCWPGVQNQTIKDIICTGHDKSGWTMEAHYALSCVMSDGIGIFDMGGGVDSISVSTNRRWRTKENCEVQRSRVLSQSSKEAEAVAYCKTYFNGMYVSTTNSYSYRDHSLITTAKNIVVGD